METDETSALLRYVHSYVTSPKPEPKRSRFFRNNPAFGVLCRTARRHDRELSDFFDAGDQRIINGLEKVVDYSNSFDAGLATGYLFEPETTLEEIRGKAEPSPEFRRGFTEGQAYGIFEKSKLLHKKAKRGVTMLAAMVGIGYASTPGMPMIKPEHAEWLKYTLPLNIGMAASAVYGELTMLATGLLGNDGFNPQKLRTTGPFKMHRNPFYASMAFATGLAVSEFAALSAMSSSPSLFYIAGMPLALAYFLKQQHANVLNDEKRLEKLFGGEYLEYKRKTPRYFPAFWKLFRRKK